MAYRIMKIEKYDGHVVNTFELGKSTTYKKCYEMIMSFIDMHNDGIVYENPKPKYAFYVNGGDIREQIMSGKVREFFHENNRLCPYINVRREGDGIVCDIAESYVYKRKAISDSIYKLKNFEIVHIYTTGVCEFIIEEV